MILHELGVPALDILTASVYTQEMPAKLMAQNHYELTGDTEEMLGSDSAFVAGV
jgi:hypothetical protein